jgi:hypothetical protein
MEPVRQRPPYMHPAPSRAMTTMSLRLSYQNRWISSGEARIRSWWSSWGTVGGQSGIATVYFLSTLTFLRQLTIPPVLNIHPSIIWAINGHSSKRYSIILTQENKYHSEWWNKEIAYSGLLRRHRKVAESDYWLRNCLSVCRCVFPWNKSAPSGRIFMEFYIWLFFENLLRKWKTCWNMTSITGTLRAGVRTIAITSRWNVFRMRNFSDKFVRKFRTHICSTYFFFFRKWWLFIR